MKQAKLFECLECLRIVATYKKDINFICGNCEYKIKRLKK